MAMETEGDRPEDGSPEDSSDWFFDLPRGAWERQEAKNRALREQVLHNINEPEDSDPFAARRRQRPTAGEGSSWLAGSEGASDPAELPLYRRRIGPRGGKAQTSRANRWEDAFGTGGEDRPGEAFAPWVRQERIHQHPSVPADSKPVTAGAEASLPPTIGEPSSEETEAPPARRGPLFSQPAVTTTGFEISHPTGGERAQNRETPSGSTNHPTQSELPVPEVRVARERLDDVVDFDLDDRGSMVEGMRAWVSRSEDQRTRPHRRLAASEDENECEDDGQTSEPAATDAKGEPERPRRGLLARLFGRAPAPENHAWEEEPEAAGESPATGSISSGQPEPPQPVSDLIRPWQPIAPPLPEVPEDLARHSGRPYDESEPAAPIWAPEVVPELDELEASAWLPLDSDAGSDAEGDEVEEAPSSSHSSAGHNWQALETAGSVAAGSAAATGAILPPGLDPADDIAAADRTRQAGGDAAAEPNAGSFSNALEQAARGEASLSHLLSPESNPPEAQPVEAPTLLSGEPGAQQSSANDGEGGLWAALDKAVSPPGPSSPAGSGGFEEAASADELADDPYEAGDSLWAEFAPTEPSLGVPAEGSGPRFEAPDLDEDEVVEPAVDGQWQRAAPRPQLAAENADGVFGGERAPSFAPASWESAGTERTSWGADPGAAEREEATGRFPRAAGKDEGEGRSGNWPSAAFAHGDGGDGPAFEPELEPFWEDESQPDDQNVVRRAFEAHAAAEEERQRSPATDQQSLADVFGDEADELMVELTSRPDGFARRDWSASTAESWGTMFVRRETGEADGGERPYALPVLKLDEPQPDETSDGGQQRQRRRFVRGLVETALLAILVFLSVRASFQNFRVDGNSMYPTLDDGQFLIVNKLVYSEIDMDKLSKFLPFVDAEENEKRYVFHGPQRGDIVVMRDPRRPDQDLIKRVIGLPGETVEIRNGMVYVNGFLLEEPYIQAAWHDSRPKVTIPEGQYFVMGDNRDNSLDSRSAQVGLISKNLIVGKAALTYWPFDKFGLAPNQFGTSQKPRLTDTPIPPADSLAGVATDESR